ncbi:hypothetical protein GCM10010330_44890 [Streptomyces tendae]|nr:hypothetical protein GCM10010330_44890 [Streptomyces tendae]
MATLKRVSEAWTNLQRIAAEKGRPGFVPCAARIACDDVWQRESDIEMVEPAEILRRANTVLVSVKGKDVAPVCRSCIGVIRERAMWHEM